VGRSLPELEAVLESCDVLELIEAAMPKGGRPRQLAVRTLLLGFMLAASEDRPAHLTRAHAALASLPTTERSRLGVTATWRERPHELTYRQFEHTNASLVAVFEAEKQDGAPGPLLRQLTEELLEASVPDELSSGGDLAVDWTDVETFARPGTATRRCADADASFGHRKGDAPGQDHEVFLGYYLQLATMVAPVGSPAVPEVVRRMLLTSCHLDPPRAFVPVLARLWSSGVAPGDVLSDCGYSSRVAEAWALPLRQMGASLVQDLHPSDRGMKGTFGGAVIWDGGLHCPATPRALFELGPLARGCTPEQTAAHDRLFAELSSHRLGRISSNSADGYHRVICPAAAGRLRCPLRPASMSLPNDRPEVVSPPGHAPTCCSQQTMTVPPTVAQKTSQRHAYPGPDWRRSYARRSSAERSNATLKDPARVSIERGWCRLMGLPAMTVMLACLVVVRNLRILESFEDGDDTSSATVPRRRRVALADLVGSTHPPP
jgi:hypothetical protein